MAGSAFEIQAQKHLRHVLCCLHLDALARIDGAAPLDALHKPGRFLGRTDEFAYKPVIGFVGFQGIVEPFGNVEAPARDVART